MDSKQLLSGVALHVSNLLNNRLKPVLYFHGQSHTENVVAAAQEIGKICAFDPDELATLTIAAWFHDTGYTEVYNGHEARSAEIASAYLQKIKMNAAFIAKVQACILSTRIPQQPITLMEEVICDADFYHLSRTDYGTFAEALRAEWEVCLNLKYTDREWNALNLEMLRTHVYFTAYGKTVLQERKEQNITRLEQLLEK